MRTLLGTIAEKDGMICLHSPLDSCWWPLGGSSGIAEDFRETFNEPQRSDLGKRLYRVDGVLQMENDAQKAARMALPRFDVLFSAARNVIGPNYYNTDRFSGYVTVSAINEIDARREAIAEVYRTHAAQYVGHVIIKTVERVDA